MAKKKVEEELDLNIDDITPIKTTEVATDAIQEAIKFIATKNPEFASEEEEWTGCLSRLKEATNKTWICVPVVDENGKLFIKTPEIGDCPASLFLDWMCLVYPLSKTLGFTEKECEEKSARETLFAQIIQSIRQIHFPKANNKLNP